MYEKRTPRQEDSCYIVVAIRLFKEALVTHARDTHMVTHARDIHMESLLSSRERVPEVHTQLN